MSNCSSVSMLELHLKKKTMKKPWKKPMINSSWKMIYTVEKKPMIFGQIPHVHLGVVPLGLRTLSDARGTDSRDAKMATGGTKLSNTYC